VSIRATFAKSCSSSSGNRFRSNCPLRSGPMPGAGPCSLLSVGPCQLRSGPKPGVGPCPLRSCWIPSAGPCPLRSGPAPGVGPCLLRCGSAPSAGPCPLRSGPAPGVGPCLLRCGSAPSAGQCLLRSVLVLCAIRCPLSASTPPHVIPQSGCSSLRPPDSGSHHQYHAQLPLPCQSLPYCPALGSSCDPSACHAFFGVDSLDQSSPQSS
jgi:hypothetical protein